MSLLLLLLFCSSVPQTPSASKGDEDDAAHVAWCSGWVDELLAGEGFEAVEPVLRRAASGVVEERTVTTVGATRPVPVGFGATFGAAERQIKLLDHAGGQARFRVRLVVPEIRAAATIDLEQTGDAVAYTLRWTSATGGRFVDVTADLLAEDPESAAALALGVDELRERLDPRLGVPLVGHLAGIAAGDLDGDGRIDLLLAAPGGVANRALLQTDDGRAVNRAHELGLDVLDATRSLVIADLNGNGANDVLVAIGDELVGFERDESGRYEVARRFPANETTSLALADVDLDGALDFYICGYANPYESQSFPVPYHDATNGVANTLWRSNGGWSFSDATVAAGLDVNNDGFSFAASFADLDADGDPDLYVANDFGRNDAYENRLRDVGRFVEVAGELGIEDLAAGMGVTFADVELDGDLDLYVANMFSSAGHRVSSDPAFRADTDDAERAQYRRHARGNSLYLSRFAAGERGFDERAVDLGVDVGWWSWGARFIDADTDGFPDLGIPAGMVTRDDPDDL